MSLFIKIIEKVGKQQKELTGEDNYRIQREDAEGLTAYYWLIARGTRQVFYAPYIAANHQLLEALRNEYHFEDE